MCRPWGGSANAGGSAQGHNGGTMKRHDNHKITLPEVTNDELDDAKLPSGGKASPTKPGAGGAIVAATATTTGAAL